MGWAVLGGTSSCRERPLAAEPSSCRPAAARWSLDHNPLHVVLTGSSRSVGRMERRAVRRIQITHPLPFCACPPPSAETVAVGLNTALFPPLTRPRYPPDRPVADRRLSGDRRHHWPTVVNLARNAARSYSFRPRPDDFKLPTRSTWRRCCRCWPGRKRNPWTTGLTGGTPGPVP